MIDENNKVSVPQIQTDTSLEGSVRPVVLPIDFVANLVKGEPKPSVRNLVRLRAGGAAVTIEDFKDGQDGQSIEILGDGVTNVENNSKIVRTSTGVLELNKVYKFTKYSSPNDRTILKWYEHTSSNGTGTGTPGEKGEKGDKGDKGDTGDTGPQGEPGEDGTSGSGVSHSWYDPEAHPVGQPLPTYELDFKTITDFPPGWLPESGVNDFIDYNINQTRPGALWSKGGPGEFIFRGKTLGDFFAPNSDFCILWRPWIVGQNTNYCLQTIILNSSTGNGVFCWTGRHGSYGTGLTYGFEKYGSVAGSPAQWNMDYGKTMNPGFMRVRRSSGSTFWAYSLDGSYWHEIADSDFFGDGVIAVGITIYGSQPVPVEGGLTVFRAWQGNGNAMRSGALVTISDGADAIPEDLEFAIVGEVGATTGAGSLCIVTMPCDGEILQSDIDGDIAGNAVVNVYKAPLATPTVYSSIVAAAKPTLSSAASATDSTLTGWTKNFAKGDRLKFVCESLSTIALVAITLRAIRT
jgi:hypothetical protein